MRTSSLVIAVQRQFLIQLKLFARILCCRNRPNETEGAYPNERRAV